jgi:hypothetical protein
MKKTTSLKKFLAGLLALIALGITSAQAGFDVVSYSETGGVTFTPGGLVTPVITGVVAIIGGVAALWVINAGVRWLRSFIKTK